VCDHVKAGDVIEVMAPSGLFVPRSLDGDFLLLAGGSGITPVFSILRTVLAKATGRVTLLYANRDEKSVIFSAELQALAAAHPARLQVIHWLDSVQGVPSVAQLTELARSRTESAAQSAAPVQAFICGPGLFMDAAVAALQALNLPSEHIHVERFVSLPDEEALAAATAAAKEAPPLPDAVDEAEVEVLLDGQVHTLHCGGTETLLEAALRAGLNAPYSCQAGMCASCMCQVVEGSVHLRHNDVLDDKDLAKAWTLACQAVPTSARLRIKFPE
jgi:3-ketosteroid 9alpha-monooxygenase subunit B